MLGVDMACLWELWAGKRLVVMKGKQENIRVANGSLLSGCSQRWKKVVVISNSELEVEFL